MKRLAIEKAEAAASSVIQPIDEVEAVWEDNEDMIKRLCGLV